MTGEALSLLGGERSREVFDVHDLCGRAIKDSGALRGLLLGQVDWRAPKPFMYRGQMNVYLENRKCSWKACLPCGWFKSSLALERPQD